MLFLLVPIWSIAVGEPTPGGEIVASVTTVVTLTGALLYHVVTCVRDYNDSHEEVNGSSELDFCYKKYIECMNGKMIGTISILEDGDSLSVTIVGNNVKLTDIGSAL